MDAPAAGPLHHLMVWRAPKKATWPPASSLSVVQLTPPPTPGTQPSKQAGSSDSADSWFLELRRKVLMEDSIKAAALAAAAIGQHTALPPLDLAALDLEHCRLMLRSRQGGQTNSLEAPPGTAPGGSRGKVALGSKGLTAATTRLPPPPVRPPPPPAPPSPLQNLGSSLERWLAAHCALDAQRQRREQQLQLYQDQQEQQRQQLRAGREYSMRTAAAMTGEAKGLMAALPPLEPAQHTSRHSAATAAVSGSDVNGDNLSALPAYLLANTALAACATTVTRDLLPVGPHLLRRFPSCDGLLLSNKAPSYNRDITRCGVSLAFVLHFAAFLASLPAEPQLCSSRQVVEHVIKPRTARTLSRYCDTLPTSLVGVPMYFVSHRWDSPFQDLVLQLVNYFQGQDAEQVFVYIDIFAVKQNRPTSHAKAVGHRSPRTAPRDAAAFEHMQDVMQHVKKVLLVLDHDAMVLTRTWVLYEVWTMLALHQDRAPASCLSILVSGISWSPVMQEVFNRVDFQTSEAFDAEHMDFILEQVQKSAGGVADANAAIVKAVMESVSVDLKAAERKLFKAGQLHSPESSEEAIEFPSHGLNVEERTAMAAAVCAGLRSHQALFLRLKGRLAEAQAALWSTIEYMLGGPHGRPDDLACATGTLSDLLLLTASQERHRDAAALCRATQERLERVLGSGHAVTLTVATSHASALLCLGQLEAAQQLASTIIGRIIPAGGLASLGLTMPDIVSAPISAGQALVSAQAASLTCPAAAGTGLSLLLLDCLLIVAQACYDRGQPLEAEVALSQAAAAGAAVLGLRHPRIAAVFRALANVCEAGGRPGDAAVWLVQARTAMSKVYTSDSTLWVQVTLQLAGCLQLLGDLATAEKLLRRLVQRDAERAAVAAVAAAEAAQQAQPAPTSTPAAVPRRTPVVGAATQTAAVPASPRPVTPAAALSVHPVTPISPSQRQATPTANPAQSAAAAGMSLPAAGAETLHMAQAQAQVPASHESSLMRSRSSSPSAIQRLVGQRPATSPDPSSRAAAGHAWLTSPGQTAQAEQYWEIPSVPDGPYNLPQPETPGKGIKKDMPFSPLTGWAVEPSSPAQSMMLRPATSPALSTTEVNAMAGARGKGVKAKGTRKRNLTGAMERSAGAARAAWHVQGGFMDPGVPTTAARRVRKSDAGVPARKSDTGGTRGARKSDAGGPGTAEVTIGAKAAGSQPVPDGQRDRRAGAPVHDIQRDDTANVAAGRARGTGMDGWGGWGTARAANSRQSGAGVQSRPVKKPSTAPVGKPRPSITTRAYLPPGSAPVAAQTSVAPVTTAASPNTDSDHPCTPAARHIRSPPSACQRAVAGTPAKGSRSDTGAPDSTTPPGSKHLHPSGAPKPPDCRRLGGYLFQVLVKLTDILVASMLALAPPALQGPGVAETKAPQENKAANSKERSASEATSGMVESGAGVTPGTPHGSQEPSAAKAVTLAAATMSELKAAADTSGSSPASSTSESGAETFDRPSTMPPDTIDARPLPTGHKSGSESTGVKGGVIIPALQLGKVALEPQTSRKALRGHSDEVRRRAHSARFQDAPLPEQARESDGSEGPGALEQQQEEQERQQRQHQLQRQRWESLDLRQVDGDLALTDKHERSFKEVLDEASILICRILSMYDAEVQWVQLQPREHIASGSGTAFSGSGMRASTNGSLSGAGRFLGLSGNGASMGAAGSTSGVVRAVGHSSSMAGGSLSGFGPSLSGFGTSGVWPRVGLSGSGASGSGGVPQLDPGAGLRPQLSSSGSVITTGNAAPPGSDSKGLASPWPDSRPQSQQADGRVGREASVKSVGFTSPRDDYAAAADDDSPDGEMAERKDEAGGMGTEPAHALPLASSKGAQLMSGTQVTDAVAPAVTSTCAADDLAEATQGHQDAALASSVPAAHQAQGVVSEAGDEGRATGALVQGNNTSTAASSIAGAHLVCTPSHRGAGGTATSSAVSGRAPSHSHAQQTASEAHAPISTPGPARPTSPGPFQEGLSQEASMTNFVAAAAAAQRMLSRRGSMAGGPGPGGGVASTSQPVGAQLTPATVERRKLLEGLAHTIHCRSAALRDAGQDQGAQQLMALGYSITRHLAGPASSGAITAIAQVVDLLVTKRRFEEARQQLQQQLKLPAMSQKGREQLKAQVGQLMTTTAFSAVLANDRELCMEALDLGGSTWQDGHTILGLAASLGHLDIVQSILDMHPATVEAVDELTGAQPLSMAAAAGHLEVVKHLLTIKGSRAFVDAPDNQGRTALARTAAGGHVEVVRVLLGAQASFNCKDNAGTTPVMAATIGNLPEVVRLLADTGAFLDWADSAGQTALMLSCILGHAAVAEVLLRAHARINLRDNQNRTAMLLACKEGQLELVTLLVLFNANLELSDAQRMTPLMHAAAAGHSRMVELLLVQKVDVASRDAKGRTCLMYAAMSGNIGLCSTLLFHCVNRKDLVKGVVVHEEAAVEGVSGSIEHRVDLALSKVGVKVTAVTRELNVSQAIAEAGIKTESIVSPRPQTPSAVPAPTPAMLSPVLPMQPEDSVQPAKALENLARRISSLPEVIQYVAATDRSKRTAADLAQHCGHGQLANLLRSLGA